LLLWRCWPGPAATPAAVASLLDVADDGTVRACRVAAVSRDLPITPAKLLG